MLRHNRLLNPIDILLFTVDKQNAVVCVPQTTAFNKKQNANKVLNPIGVLLFGIDKQCVVVCETQTTALYHRSIINN